MTARAIPLHLVEASAPLSTDDAIREMLSIRDSAAEVVRDADARIRELARKWADERPDGVKLFTRPTVEMLRRELL